MSPSISMQTLVDCLPHVAWGLFCQTNMGLPEWIGGDQKLRISEFLNLIQQQDERAIAYIDAVALHSTAPAAATWQQLMHGIRQYDPSKAPLPGSAVQRIAEGAVEQQVERQRFEQAEKKTDFKGWVYWEGCPSDIDDFTQDGSGRDGYFSSVEELKGAIAAYNQHHPTDFVELPPYVWCCQKVDVASKTAHDIFCDSFEELYEEAWDDVPKGAIIRLDEALESFRRATLHIVSYRPSYKHALLIGLCPAQVNKSIHYPEVFGDKVPKRIRVLKDIRSDIPFSPSRVLEGYEYPAWTNEHGAVSAVLEDGSHFGVKPHEFEVIDWHE